MRDRDSQDEFHTYQRGSSANRPADGPPKPNIWQKMSRFMEVVIYILVILVVAKLFSPELKRAEALEAEKQRLEIIRNEKSQQVAKLRRENENLANDPRYLETVARDRLNLQKKGEYIVQIVPPEPAVKRSKTKTSSSEIKR